MAVKTYPIPKKDHSGAAVPPSSAASHARENASRAIVITTVILMVTIFVYWIINMPLDNSPMPSEQNLIRIFWYYFQPMLYWLGAIVLESITVIVGYALSILVLKHSIM